MTTVKKLKEFCRKHKIRGYSKLKKKELIALARNARSLCGENNGIHTVSNATASPQPPKCCNEVDQNIRDDGDRRTGVSYIYDNFNGTAQALFDHLNNNTVIRSLEMIPTALNERGMALGNLIAGGPDAENGTATIFEVITRDGRACEFILNIHTRYAEEDEVLRIWRGRTYSRDYNTLVIPLIPPTEPFRKDDDSAEMRMHFELQSRYAKITEAQFWNDKTIIAGLFDVLFDLAVNMIFERDIQSGNIMMCNGHVVKIDFGDTHYVKPTDFLNVETLSSWIESEEWAYEYIMDIGPASHKRLIYALHLLKLYGEAVYWEKVDSELAVATLEEIKRLRVASTKDKDLGPPDDALTAMINRSLDDTPMF